MTDAPKPPVTKYKLTVTIHGNTHEEIESELLTLTRGGYLLASDYHQRAEFDAIGGRDSKRLEHTNPDMTPERYREELDEWWKARRAERCRGATETGLGATNAPSRVSPVVRDGDGL